MTPEQAKILVLEAEFQRKLAEQRNRILTDIKYLALTSTFLLLVITVVVTHRL